MCNIVIGVDLGGTQMRAARFDCALNLVERVAEPTLAARGRDDVMERLLGVIQRVLPDDLSEVDGIGVSAPGPTDPRAGMLYSPPNLPGWDRVPLRKIVQERLGVTTYLGNDANVAALAEATAGAAVGYKHVIYLTFSTGIGSGIIDDGHLLIGSRGLGAEAGHMILEVDGRISTLEKEAAGPAIARKAVERLKAGAASQIRDMVNGDLSHVTAKLVGQAATAGDTLAVELMQQAGYTLGLGIVSLLHLFNPEIVVVGGGVSLMGDMVFVPMREAVEKYVIDPAYCENVPIVPAALGDNVGLIGAAALVTTRGGSYL